MGKITTGSRPSIDRSVLTAPIAPVSGSMASGLTPRSREKPHSTRRGHDSLFWGLFVLVVV